MAANHRPCIDPARQCGRTGGARAERPAARGAPWLFKSLLSVQSISPQASGAAVTGTRERKSTEWCRSPAAWGGFQPGSCVLRPCSWQLPCPPAPRVQTSRWHAALLLLQPGSCSLTGQGYGHWGKHHNTALFATKQLWASHLFAAFPPPVLVAACWASPCSGWLRWGLPSGRALAPRGVSKPGSPKTLQHQGLRSSLLFPRQFITWRFLFNLWAKFLGHSCCLHPAVGQTAAARSSGKLQLGRPARPVCSPIALFLIAGLFAFLLKRGLIRSMTSGVAVRGRAGKRPGSLCGLGVPPLAAGPRAGRGRTERRCTRTS